MKQKKQQYGPPIRIWLSTHKRLKSRLRGGKTMTQLVDELSQPKRGVPIRGSIN